MSAPLVNRSSFGFFNVIKPPGVTSYDVIRRIKPLLARKAKVGHSGVIDKPACGVLPLGVGRATKLFSKLSEWTKDYYCWLAFGITSPTLDLASECTVSTLPEDDASITALAHKLLDIVPDFVGQIEQLPPSFSNVKVEGKELYRYELKTEEVEVKPRRVEIQSIEVLRLFHYSGGELLPIEDDGLPRGDAGEKYGFPALEFQSENAPPEGLLVAETFIECSTGAYIRALARDIGAALGTGGVLASLVRTRVGPFEHSGATSLEELAAALEEDREEAFERFLLPASIVAKPSVRLTVYFDEARNLSIGSFIVVTGKRLPDELLALLMGGLTVDVFAVMEDGRLVALCKASSRDEGADLWKIKPLKVFLD